MGLKKGDAGLPAPPDLNPKTATKSKAIKRSSCLAEAQAVEPKYAHNPGLLGITLKNRAGTGMSSKHTTMQGSR